MGKARGGTDDNLRRCPLYPLQFSYVGYYTGETPEKISSEQVVGGRILKKNSFTYKISLGIYRFYLSLHTKIEKFFHKKK